MAKGSVEATPYNRSAVPLSLLGFMYPRLLLFLAYLILVTGCDTTGDQRDFTDDARLPPDGITATDDRGNILSDDSDDWRTSPRYVTRVIVDPAFPNPTGGSFVTLNVTVREFNAVVGGLELGSFDAQGRFTRLDDISRASDPGLYTFVFNPATLGRPVGSLVRIYILDDPGEIVSYGDLRL